MTSFARQIGIVQAATNLGLHPGGVELLGRALVDAGLAERLSAVEIVTVVAPAYLPVRDNTTQTNNAGAIAVYSRQLAAAVGDAVRAGYFPLVLGGDCSILLGDLLAFDGRRGLLFIDGHTDCYDPAASTGEVAELELGIAMGLTTVPGPLADLGGGAPLVRASDVVLIGARDHEEPGWRPAPSQALTIDLPELARLGIDETVARALERLSRDELDGFWVHLDVDVLDDRIMPAVDYRSPGGLSWDDLVSLLRAAFSCGRALGAEVTIFNPSLDPHHSVRRALVAVLTRALRSEQSDRR